MPAGPQCPMEPDGVAWLSQGARHERAAWLATAAWTGMGVLLWAMFPMTAAVLLPMCSIAPLAWFWAKRGCLPRHPLSAATVMLGLVAVYLAINASWSLSPQTAAMAIVLLLLMVATLQIVLNALRDLGPAPLNAMALGALAGLTVAGALLCVEVYGDQLLRRLLIRLVPALQPYPQHVVTDGGQMVRLAPYLTNASIGVLTVMFWPAVLIASRLGLLRAWKVPSLIAIAVAVATVLASEHGTSQAAFLGAGLTFALFQVRPQLGKPILTAGWMTATLLVVPLVSLLYGAEAYRAPWLPESARHRVVIWHATAQEVPKSPLLGAGIGSARVAREALGARNLTAPGTTFQLSPSLHSHNAYLQVWYEAGAVGALILLGLGLVILRSLQRLAPDMQPFLAAAFAAGALLIASAYSIWAPWFMASLAMTGIFAALGAALPERTPPGALG
jgi:O-antigen ligase